MGRLRNLLIPGVDKKLLVRDAVKTMPELTRRRFNTAGTSLGALTLLTGCDVSDSMSAGHLIPLMTATKTAPVLATGCDSTTNSV